MSQFLEYLKKLEILNSEQIQQCVDYSAINEKSISQSLIQQNYLTEKKLNQLVNDFNQTHEITSLSPKPEDQTVIEKELQQSLKSKVQDEEEEDAHTLIDPNLQPEKQNEKVKKIISELESLAPLAIEKRAVAPNTLIESTSSKTNLAITSTKTPINEATSIQESSLHPETTIGQEKDNTEFPLNKSLQKEEVSNFHNNSKEEAESNLVAELSLFAKKKAQEEENTNPYHGTLIAKPLVLPAPESTLEIQPERYQILENLGEGGMGVVHRVQDRILKREVALKRVKSQKGTLSPHQKMMLWRLNREAEITAILEHPNIVPLYDLQKKSNGELYFTMRRVKGETLHNILKKIKADIENYSENQILSIFLKVCDAIAYAHSEGVVHRDLKPDNIMVGSFGEVYVMDWGIAKKQGEQKEIAGYSSEAEKVEGVQQAKEYATIGGMGTPGYMAPEQQEEASHVTSQSDIFSLGKMLRQCFTLLSPMEELKQEIELQKKKKQSTEDLDIQTLLAERIPEDIVAIVEKATQIKPQDRYLEVQELSQDVQRYLGNVEISVREYSIFEAVEKFIKRNKQKVFFVSIICSICIIYPLYFQLRLYQKKQKNFINAYQKAEKQILFSKKIKDFSREERRQKMEYLLDALNQLNRALSFNPEEEKTQQKKEQVGKEIIRLCYISADYQLANYVAKNLQDLNLLSKENKQKILAEVKIKRDEKRKEHQARFHYWKNRFQNNEQEYGESSNAIFEISKMSEPEIFQQLLQILKEGTNYFLTLSTQGNSKEETAKKPTQDNFYRIMVMALGRLENSKAGQPLFNALTKITNYLLTLPINQQPIEITQHAIEITKALGNSKAPGFGQKIFELRLKMGEHSNFWVNTAFPYRMMARLDGLSTKNIKREAQAYFNRGSIKVENIVAFRVLTSFTKEFKFSSLITKQQRDELKNAIQDFDEAIKLKPNYAKAYNGRAIAKMHLEHFEEAFKDLEKALQIDPNEIDAYLNLFPLFIRKNKFDEAKLILQQGFEKNLSQSQQALFYFHFAHLELLQYNLSQSEEYGKKALKLNPNFIETYNLLCTIYKEMGDFEAAQETLNQAIKISPNSSNFYINRAYLKMLLNNLDGALIDINKSLDFSGDLEGTLNLRALIKIKKDDFLGAIEDSKRAIQKNPTYAIPYNTLGTAYLENKNVPEALKHFNKAIQLKPDFVLAHINRGKAYSLLKQPRKAYQNYNKVINFLKKEIDMLHQKKGTSEEKSLLNETVKEYSTALTLRANLILEQNKPKLALKDFNQALQINPKNQEAFKNRAYAKLMLKNYEAAIQDYSSAIELNPKDPNPYNNRGNCWQHLGELEKSLLDYTKAIELNPQYVSPYTGRGTCNLKLKKYQAALLDYNQAILLDPSKVDAFISRGIIQMQLKEFAKAIEDFNKATIISPKNPYVYYYRGGSQYNIKNFLAAKTDYQKFLQLIKQNKNPQLKTFREAIYNKFPELKANQIE